MNIGADAEQAFHRIAEAAEKLLPLLLEDEQKKVQDSIGLLKRKVIPLVHHECPLLVAVTGGGSVGKSTLFNMLAGGKFSGVKSKAGYTRRTLAAIHPSVARSEDRMALLFELFKKNARPVLLKSPNEMLEQGDPLYVESNNISENMAVLDTPDFDTGSIDEFANRAAAEEILAASDVLVYLFTNQTYNNKANTDFVRNAISGIGRRKVVLIYRCSAAYPDEEVGEHMDEVLRNLFPDSASPRSEALGLYRVDESDAVVKGAAAPTIRPFGDCLDIMRLINGLNIVDIRKDNLISQCEAIVREMKNALDKASLRRYELVAYRDAVRALASHAVRDSLKNFPQGLVMEQFVECWRAAQPKYVRLAHWGGSRLSECLKWCKRIIRPQEGDAKKPGAEDYAKTFRNDFTDIVAKLREKMNLPALNVEVPSRAEDTAVLRNAVKELALRDGGRYGSCEHGEMFECSVSRPTILAQKFEDELKRITDSGNDYWIDDAVNIVSVNDDIREDIKALVADARRNMSFREKSKEGLWATAAVVPPILAVTWVVGTADVVGGGLVAHLSTMFGLGDMCALVAVPVSLGLNEKHKKSLERQLACLYEIWFEKKRAPIAVLINENMTARCTGLFDELLEKTEGPLNRLHEAVKAIEA